MKRLCKNTYENSIVPTLQRLSLCTSPVESENFVIPAWMPVSSAMDGNFAALQVLDQREAPADSFSSMCSGFRQSLPE
ncbi:MAG: hypothetical protein Q8L15_10135 [Methylobacter sp.]|nr:hypothetical protein [Methylobacter sp.]